MIDKLKQLKDLALQSHHTCEDYYYNCAITKHYRDYNEINEPDLSKECTCGADSHNKKVEELYASILDELKDCC